MLMPSPETPIPPSSPDREAVPRRADLQPQAVPPPCAGLPDPAFHNGGYTQQAGNPCQHWKIGPI